MQKILTYRMLNAINVVMAIIAMTFALLYLQKHLGLSPCPLCVFQRIGLMVMGVFSFVALLINPKKRWAQLLLWLGSFAGIAWSTAVAARHVYIQHLPADQVPTCGPGLDYWVDTLPVLQVMQEVLRGSGSAPLLTGLF